MKHIFLSFVLLLVVTAATAQSLPPYRNTALPIDVRVNDLLGRMTLDEKIDLLKQQTLTSIERIDEYRGILHVRRHLAATPIFKGIPNFRDTRIRMLRAESKDELFAIIEETRTLLKTLPIESIPPP